MNRRAATRTRASARLALRHWSVEKRTGTQTLAISRIAISPVVADRRRLIESRRILAVATPDP